MTWHLALIWFEFMALSALFHTNPAELLSPQSTSSGVRKYTYYMYYKNSKKAETL